MTAGFFQSKPRPAIFKLPEDTSKIFKHHGENQQDFDTVVKFINYFQEMFKFFPEWKQKGYWTGAESDLTKNSPGLGKYSDPKDKGLKNSGKLGSGYQERYGDWHDVSLGETHSWPRRRSRKTAIKTLSLCSALIVICVIDLSKLAKSSTPLPLEKPDGLSKNS